MKPSIDEQREALNHALRYYNFPEKYFVKSAEKGLGKKFAVASEAAHGGVNTHTNYMNYSEFNCFLLGFAAHTRNIFK